MEVFQASKKGHRKNRKELRKLNGFAVKTAINIARKYPLHQVKFMSRPERESFMQRSALQRAAQKAFASGEIQVQETGPSATNPV